MAAIQVSWVLVVLFLFCNLNASVGQQTTPIKFCRTQATLGALAALDSRIREGYVWWTEWVNNRSGIQVGDTRRPITFITYEDASNEQLQYILYERLLTVDNCDFLFAPVATGTVGVNFFQMLENGYGWVDKTTPIKQVPYFYRHGGNAGILWTKPWNWTFSMLPSETNRPLPCFSEFQKAGFKTAWIIYTYNEPGFNFNLTASTLQKGFDSYGIDATLQGISVNISLVDLWNLTVNASLERPDVLAFRVQNTTMINRILEWLRRDLNYQPETVFVFGDNILGPGNSFLPNVPWAGNLTTATGSWVPTTQFSDPYFGTAVDLYNNISARFSNNTVNELHIASASAGLLFLIAIEETQSTDPVVIRNFLRAFNRTTSYGPVSWYNTGELSSTSWQCLQNNGTKTEVISASSAFRHPTFAIPPPLPPRTRPPSPSHTSRNILIGVFSGLVFLLLVAAIIFLIAYKRYHLIMIPKDDATAGEEWGE